MAVEITDVAGIGPKMAEQLEQHGISTAEQLIAAGSDKLTQVPGISQAKAEAFLDAARQLVGDVPPAQPVDVEDRASPSPATAGKASQDAEPDVSAEDDKKSKKHKKKKEKRLKDKKIKDKKKKDRKKKKKKNRKSKRK